MTLYIVSYCEDSGTVLTNAFGQNVKMLKKSNFTDGHILGLRWG